VTHIVDELRAGGDVAPAPVSYAQETSQATTHQSRDDLFTALAEFDGARGQFVASVLAAKLTTLQLLDLVYLPILVRAGDLWQKKQISVAQEHYISSFIRLQLFALLNVTPPPVHTIRRALICTPEGELHEGGVLMLAVNLKLRGWQIVYLGPNCPADEIQAAARQIKPDVVCVSLTMQDGAAKAVQAYGKINARVCVGGQAVLKFAREKLKLPSNVQICRSSGNAAADFVELISGEVAVTTA
jgi:methanogenic corrinoid protein MtbC1